ncbi:MAG TPA: hypothetical protein VHS28_00225, partial [Chloroflexota bacterium]|nr:hypothetical protein [Chloroflexota bacterium]
MGSCLRHCLPAHLRLWDRDYSSAPRRKQPFVPNTETLPRYVQEEMTAAALAANVDFVMVHDEAGLQSLGIDYKDRLPDAVSAVTMGSFIPQSATANEMAIAAYYFAQFAAFRAARKLENLGYSVVVSTDLSQDVFKPAVAGLAPEGWQSFTATFFTSAPVVASQPSQQSPAVPQPKNLTRALKAMAKQWDVDQIGVASVERIAELKKQLAPIMDGEKVWNAVNKGKMWLEFEPEVTEGERKLRDAADLLPDAKSVVVVGLRLPEATVERVFQPPTEVVGPYVFAQYVVQWILREKALVLAKWLRNLGYKAEVSLDLMNTGSIVANPRGPQQSAFSNRFEAVAAGLGAITKGGFVTTHDFGTNMRYLAVVTDAPFEADVLQNFESFLSACDNCDKCMQACPPQAYSDEVTISLEGQPISFRRLDQKRCDWCARYGLMGGDGFANMGVDKDIYPPDEITSEALAAGLSTLDTVQGHHRCGVESCVVNCPLSK